MAGYCTLVLYFHSPAAREITAAHSCNIQPYYLLTHQIIYIYIYTILKIAIELTSVACYHLPQLQFLKYCSNSIMIRQLTNQSQVAKFNFWHLYVVVAVP